MPQSYQSVQVNRTILTDDELDFCKGQAEAFWADKGISLSPNDGSSAPVDEPPGSLYHGLVGGAFYDRTQNTMYTPANIFWARFNRVRQGGASTLFSYALQSGKEHAFIIHQSLSCTVSIFDRHCLTWCHFLQRQPTLECLCSCHQPQGWY